LQFSLRGTPVLRYGEEIGMGEDLSLGGRDAIRTPMQWSAGLNGGFSTAEKTIRPVIEAGEFGTGQVNVIAQQQDPGSLLSWFERMIRILRQCPEIGLGECTIVDVPVPRQVLVHQAANSMCFVHNLSDKEVEIDLSPLSKQADHAYEMLADRGYPPVDDALSTIPVAGLGYRWIRLQDSIARRAAK
jgi:maltose alpha-D-glucosyltransferase/alpha-amylase